MAKLKVLIIGRKSFRNLMGKDAFPNCRIFECWDKGDIRRKCANKNLVVVEQRFHMRDKFLSTKKLTPESLIVDFNSLNPFDKPRNYKRGKIELNAETRIIFIGGGAWDKIYYLDNGKSGYINAGEIIQGKIANSFLKRAQKTPVSS